MWVVKLGGSLVDADELPRWLEALSELGCVIVPGGGPFADAVRLAQQRWRFDDGSAHRMAILAMRQYGLMLAALHPRLRAAPTSALPSQPGPAQIWLPDPDELDQAGIPASWDITSDSLAAWLAGQIGATHLLLVKSVAPDPNAPLDFARIAKLGWTDPVFYQYAANARCLCWLCGRSGYADLAHAFAQPADRFIRIAN